MTRAAAAVPLRTRVARVALRVVSRLARVRGSSGTVIGARVGLAIDPDLVRHLAAGRSLATVSATNGKTTTTSLLRAALATLDTTLSNNTGSNLATGVATALSQSGARLGAIEVDEAALVGLLPQLQPQVVVLGNLSRDQLDRYGEVRLVAAKWRSALRDCEATVVANSQDPLVTWAAGTAPHVVWVAPGLRWRADATTCPECGGLIEWGPPWRCPSCGLTQPAAEWAWNDKSVTGPAGFASELDLLLPGDFNRGNALLALAAAASMGVDPATSVGAMETVREVAGRFAEVNLAGAPTRLMLAKNPAGWTELLHLALQDDPNQPLIVGINARVADGHDTSWLWDVPFEELQGRQVYATGDRRYDVALRLHYAGAAGVQVAPTAEQARAEIARRDVGAKGPITFIGNYTAFADVARLTGAT